MKEVNVITYLNITGYVNNDLSSLDEVRVNKIQTIKSVRVAVGCGLYEAKQITDRFFDDMDRMREITLINKGKLAETEDAIEKARVIFFSLDGAQRVMFTAFMKETFIKQY